MKKVFIFALMALGLAMGSCVDSKLDPLSGNYLPAPTVVKFTKVDNSETFKDDAGRRIFVLDFSDGASNKLHAVLVGSNYYLSSNTYTEASDATANTGNFITPSTTFNGQSVRSGSVTVKQNGSNYSVSGVLFMQDGTPYTLEWVGTLNYVKEPLPPVAYTFTVAKPADVTDASNAVVSGVKSNMVTLVDFDGNFAAQFNLILADGNTNIVGSYHVEEYASKPYAAGNGFDMTPYGWPIIIGSYYVRDGENVIIEPGEFIDVYVEDGVYVFEGSTGYTFVAQPEAVDPNLWPTIDLGENLVLLGTTSDPASNMISLQIGTSGLSKPFTKESSGYYIDLVLYSKDGYLHQGDYNPGDGSKGTYLMGHDVFEPGVAMNEGTTLNLVKGTVIESRNINAGTVQVGWDNENETWTIDLESEQVVLHFNDEVPGLTSEGVLISDVDPSILTQVLSVQSNLGSGVKSLTLNFGTDDLAISGYNTTGVGYKLSMDIYSEDGKLHGGLYSACAVGGTINEDEFGIGYDADLWGMHFENWGTCWWTYDNDAAKNSVEKITDGTVYVVYNPDTKIFTVSVESSVINTTYTGPIEGIEGVAEVDDYDGIKVDVCKAVTDNSASSKILTLEFWSEGISASMNESWQTVYSGNGYRLTMDIYSADGKLAPGVYTACAVGGAVGEGEFGIGYDADMWGMHFENWGTCWWTVVDGNITGVKITDGTVTVKKAGDVYTILVESSAVTSARFKGKLVAQ